MAPEETFSAPVSWNAILHRYTRGPVDEVILERKTFPIIKCDPPPGFFFVPIYCADVVALMLHNVAHSECRDKDGEGGARCI